MSSTRSALLLISVLGVVVGSVATTAVGNERISNGGFETGAMDPWFDYRFGSINTGKWSVVSDRPHSGAYSALAVTEGRGGVTRLSQSFPPVAVDDLTYAGLWYFNEPTGGTGTVGLATGLIFSDGSTDQDTLFANDPTYKENAWAFRDLLPTLRQNPGKYLVELGVFDKLNTRTYIDDVSVVGPPCMSDPVCLEAGNCSDGIDNDGDGSTDCADADCATVEECQEEGNCADGEDNDGDGKTDCADSDCASACVPTLNHWWLLLLILLILMARASRRRASR